MSDNDLILGRLEVTIKINEMPTSQPVENGWHKFEVDCEGTLFSITVRPRIWKKLVAANEEYPMWVASITGKLGKRSNKGFVLDSPAIQVFEKKQKPPKEEVSVQE